MSYHSLPIGSNYPESFNVVVEIAKGGHNKYEYDETSGIIKLDRVLHSPMFYPVDYGFIPETRSSDGDHLDALVLTDSPTFPGCIVEARAIGLLQMIDGGEADEKILAVPVKNPRYKSINTLDDLEPHILDEIKHFFEQYKKLEKKEVEVKNWEPRENALATLKEAHENFKKNG